jgi:hypothetical protein
MQPEFDLGLNEALYAAIRYDEQMRPLSEIIRRSNFPGLDLVPGAIEVSEFEYDTPHMLANSDSSANATCYSRLGAALAEVRDDYDIACSCSLGRLAKLLAIQSYNGRRRCQADADLATLVDQEAFGGGMPNKVLGG